MAPGVQVRTREWGCVPPAAETRAGLPLATRRCSGPRTYRLRLAGARGGSVGSEHPEGGLQGERVPGPSAAQQVVAEPTHVGELGRLGDLRRAAYVGGGAA